MIKGLSIPICAPYAHDGNGKVTYSEPYVADHAVEYSIEVSSSDSNDFYADNRVQESAAGKFADGTLTLKTADLEPALAKKIVGLKTATRTIGGKQISEIVYDDDQKSPDLGFGIIEEHEIDGVTKYLPVVLAKVRFNIPKDAATTRGDQIEWQSKEITAKIMRSDQVDEDYNHPWKFNPEELMETEAEAKAYIETVLGKDNTAA